MKWGWRLCIVTHLRFVCQELSRSGWYFLLQLNLKWTLRKSIYLMTNCHFWLWNFFYFTTILARQEIVELDLYTPGYSPCCVTTLPDPHTTKIINPRTSSFARTCESHLTYLDSHSSGQYSYLIMCNHVSSGIASVY